MNLFSKPKLEIREISEIDKKLLHLFINEVQVVFTMIEIINNSHHKFGAFLDNIMVGFIDTEDKDQTFEIHAIHVKKSFRKKKIAKQFLMKVIELAKTKN